jgi:hypothetical protein
MRPRRSTGGDGETSSSKRRAVADAAAQPLTLQSLLRIAKDGEVSTRSPHTLTNVDVSLNGVVEEWIREHPKACITFDNAEVQARVKAKQAQLLAGSRLRETALKQATTTSTTSNSLGFNVGPYIGTLRVDQATCRLPAFNSAIRTMDDSSEFIFNNPAEMFRRYERDGYLLLRGLIDKRKIDTAREAVNHVAQEMWGLDLDDGMTVKKPPASAALSRATRGVAGGYDVQVELPSGEAWLQGMGHDKTKEDEEVAKWLACARGAECRGVLDSKELRGAIAQLCEGVKQVCALKACKSRTARNAEWLRMRGTGVQAREAADYFYLKQETGEENLDWDVAVAREALCEGCGKSRLMMRVGDSGALCVKCRAPVIAVACWVPLGPCVLPLSSCARY